MAPLSLLLVGATTSGLTALTSRRAARREAAAERAFPPTGRLLKVGPHTVHAHVEGSGPDLILIHGASGNTRDFTFSLVGRLAPDYRVIVFDRPGLGWSSALPGADSDDPAAQARVMQAAADQLGVTRPIVLGQSYGGAVALAWALERRRDTGALVLIAAASNPWPGGLGAWYRIASSRLGQAAAIPLLTAYATRAKMLAVIRSIFAPEPMPAGYAEYVGASLTLRRASMRLNVSQVNALLSHVRAMAPHYPGLRLPVEILHGDADTTVPLEVHSIPLARQIPDAVLTVLPGAGHMPHHTRTEDTIAAIHRAASRAGLR